MTIEARLRELGLTLPAAPNLPPHVVIPFQWVRVAADRAFISGHGSIDERGVSAGPFGRVPDEVSLEDAQASARSVGLAMLGSLQRTIGSLDRVRAWLTVSGFVNAQPGYASTTLVMNPISDLLIEVFGPDVGAHARTAIGAATLPVNVPVIAAAEVLLHP